MIRVHRYGIMTVWSISWVKGPDNPIFQNFFTIESKEGERVFYSRKQAEEHLAYLLNSVPPEFKEEFFSHKDILIKGLN
jgi:hypothetical protein